MQIPCKPVHVTIRRGFLKSNVFHNIVGKLKECVQRLICSIKCNRVRRFWLTVSYMLLKQADNSVAWMGSSCCTVLSSVCVYVDMLFCVAVGWGGQNSEKNMLTCILYVVSATDMVGVMWWNTGNNIEFTEFPISRHLRMYPGLWWRPILSYKQMQKVNNSGIEKVIWHHCSEAQVQECTAFPGSLVYHRHWIGELYTMMLSIHIALEVYNTSR